MCSLKREPSFNYKNGGDVGYQRGHADREPSFEQKSPWQSSNSKIQDLDKNSNVRRSTSLLASGSGIMNQHQLFNTPL